MSVYAPLRWREVMAEGCGPLTLGIVLIKLVTAVQSLVVTAIVPAVRHDLGGGLAAVAVTGRLPASLGAPPPLIAPER